MKQIIVTALEAIEQKKRNIHFMFQDKRQIEARIMKESEEIDGLETEIRDLKESEEKGKQVVDCKQSVNDATTNV